MRLSIYRLPKTITFLLGLILMALALLALHDVKAYAAAPPMPGDVGAYFKSYDTVTVDPDNGQIDPNCYNSANNYENPAVDRWGSQVGDQTDDTTINISNPRSQLNVDIQYNLLA